MTANVVLTIDHSGSMRSMANAVNTYLDSAKSVCNLFVNAILQDGDQFGVVAFSTKVESVYPSSGLATVSTTTQEAAIKAIDGIKLAMWTDLAGAITKSYTVLGGVSSHRGIILASDGMQEGVKGDAVADTKKGGPPIYTISLGNQTLVSVMKQIAKKSGGKFYPLPSMAQLNQIYNDIAGDAKYVNVLLNQSKRVQKYNLQSGTATVDPGQSGARFSVFWEDDTVNYIGGYPGQNQLTVELYDPSSKTVDVKPSSAPAGGNYAVFEVASPVKGTWKVNVVYGESAKMDDLSVTLGSFEPPGGALAMSLVPDAAGADGAVPEVAVHLTHDGEPLRDAYLEVTADTPRHSLPHLLEEHRGLYESVTIPVHLRHEDLPDSAQRLEALRELLLPELDLFARRRVPLPLTRCAGAGAVARIALDSLRHPGAHSVHVRATGVTPGGDAFSRERVLTLDNRPSDEA